MTNKEFLEYMKICGKIDLTTVVSNNTIKSNLDVFNNSDKEVWKYWILLESIEMDKINILYTMRIMIEQNLNESEIKELIENMRVLSRIAVMSWHDICKKFEESIVSHRKINEITLSNKDGVYLIIDNECINIEWQENTFDKVDVRVNDALYKDIEKLILKNETKFELLNDSKSVDEKELSIVFKRAHKYYEK